MNYSKSHVDFNLMPAHTYSSTIFLCILLLFTPPVGNLKGEPHQNFLAGYEFCQRQNYEF